MRDCVILLWWGRDLCLLAEPAKVIRRVVAGGEDPARAAARLIEEGAPEAAAVRLVYHPETVDLHVAARPGARRVRRAFAVEFPEMAEPGVHWAAEPVGLRPGGGDAVLYVDRHSRLPFLRRELGRRGVRLEGAWPLQSLIEVRLTAETGFLGLLALAGRSLVFCADPRGGRQVRTQEGTDFFAAAAVEWGGARARFEEDERLPGLLVIEEDSGMTAAALAGAETLAALTWEEFLGRARDLPAGGAADFLAGRARWWPGGSWRRRSLLAGGVAGVAALTGLSASLWRKQADWQRQSAVWNQQRAELEGRLQIRRREMERTDAGEAAGRQLETAPQLQGQLLMTLAQGTPAAISLEEVQTDDVGFVIRGRIDDPTGDPLRRLCRELAASGASWRLTDPPLAASPAAGDAEFTLRGSFAPPSGASGGAGGTEERIAVLRSLLPAAESFEGWLRSEAGGWTVEGTSAEKFPGFEVRRYRLSHGPARLGTWAEILRTVNQLCAKPGLTIDTLDLAAAPDGADAFQRVALALTARLR